MDILDLFNNDMFTVMRMSESMELLPWKPKFLGQLIKWEPDPITTDVTAVEHSFGHITLLATAARGSHANTEHSNKRTVRKVSVPHVPQHSDLNADDILGIRATGSTTVLETIASKVAQRLQQHQSNHDVTMEMHRAGAVCGKLREPDGTVILDLFDHFGITETEVEFNWASATEGAQQLKCLEVINTMEDTLQADVSDGVVGLVDDAFFAKMMANAEFRESYLRWQSGQFYRDALPGRNKLFTWGGISWYNYRGKIGATSFLNADSETGGFARFFPTGVPGLWKETMAPADYMDTVNTLGKRFYASQERMPHNKGIKFETQSNVLYYCTRPSVLIKGTTA